MKGAKKSPKTTCENANIKSWFEDRVHDVANDKFCDTLYGNACPAFSGWDEALEWADVKLDLNLPRLENAEFRCLTLRVVDATYNAGRTPEEMAGEIGKMIEPVLSFGQNAIRLHAWADFTCEIENESSCITRDKGQLLSTAWLVFSGDVTKVERQLGVDDESQQEVENAAEQEAKNGRTEWLRVAMAKCVKKDGLREQDVVAMWRELSTIEPVQAA